MNDDKRFRWHSAEKCTLHCMKILHVLFLFLLLLIVYLMGHMTIGTKCVCMAGIGWMPKNQLHEENGRQRMNIVY